MKNIFSKAVSAIDVREIAGFAGLSMLFYGCQMVSLAAAFVVVGGILTLLAVRG
jgi:hypothetical protein